MSRIQTTHSRPCRTRGDHLCRAGLRFRASIRAILCQAPAADESMTMGYFTDSSHQPSPEEIRLALGSRTLLWERLTRFIETRYQIEGEWSTWGPARHGWGLRYRRKGKALVALYPQKEMLVAQVVLGKAQAERALTLKLGEKVSKMLREAPQLRDGRWLSIPVLNEADAEDVEQLLLTKMRPAGCTG